jgi:flagellin
MAQKLRAAITGSGGTNIGAVAGVDGGDPLADDSTVTITATGGAVTWTQSTNETTFQQSQIDEDDSIEVTIKGGTISTGDTFSVGGVSYTALEGDTINDVAAGLKEALDGESIDNLVVTVGEADDPATGDATLTLTATGGNAVVGISDLGATNVAVAAGGLGALADIDVSDSAGATAALTSIETLLNKAITAATTFGSAQKQIEGQTEFVQNLVDSMKSGIGAMVDADIEAASAKLQALQVQQQLGVQALSIANSAPQTLLSLFR